MISSEGGKEGSFSAITKASLVLFFSSSNLGLKETISSLERLLGRISSLFNTSL